MLFNSYIFLGAFLPLTLFIFLYLRRFPDRRWGIVWLILASLFYYSWWNPYLLLLLITSILVNAGFGKALTSGRLSPRAAKATLIGGLTFNLGLLFFFKYTGFVVENLNDHFGARLAVPQIILPIGISFITFQKIAFLVDAYRGEVRNLSFANFTLFVTFFPQLIAGPIVHHSEVMPQFAAGPGSSPARRDDLAIGFSLFTVGLFKKAVIADTLAVFADGGYDAVHAGVKLHMASAWVAVLAYTFQIYYDFSGYSDMAVGLARMFGIRFPVNFHSPYKATGIVDFWRRWHMTFSRFLRDYLYFPLGGNRRGPLRQGLNLCIVMLLGGLWHGAKWTFVLWGAVHGLMLVVNHAWSRLPLVSLRPLTWVFRPLTFLLVTLAWVPFRADSLRDTRRMFGFLFPPADSLDLHFWRAVRALEIQFTAAEGA